jgi:hypothetical protein
VNPSSQQAEWHHTLALLMRLLLDDIHAVLGLKFKWPRMDLQWQKMAEGEAELCRQINEAHSFLLWPDPKHQPEFVHGWGLTTRVDY